MKVVLAGQSKTGTKSMARALQELGMNVYDSMEHYVYLEKDWIKLLTKGGTVDNLRRMYQGVDAVTDVPAWYFWEEFLQAFPETKIILTEREEDSWFQSLKNQTEAGNTAVNISLVLLSPTYQRFAKFMFIIGTALFKSPTPSIFSKLKSNELLSKMQYRRHNTYVKAVAPKDKLLVFNVKDGWEPLCKFLDVSIPDKPFPHRNKKGEILNEFMQTHPVFIQMKREMNIAMGCIGASFIYFGFKTIKFFMQK